MEKDCGKSLGLKKLFQSYGYTPIEHPDSLEIYVHVLEYGDLLYLGNIQGKVFDTLTVSNLYSFPKELRKELKKRGYKFTYSRDNWEKTKQLLWEKEAEEMYNTLRSENQNHLEEK